MDSGKTIVILSDTSARRIGNDHLLVHAESGAWLVADEEARRAVESLAGEPLSFGDLGRRLGGEMADVLVSSGLALPEESVPEASALPRWEDPGQIFVVLHLTDRCSNACAYCYADTQPRGAGRRMTGRVLERVVRLLVESDCDRITLGLHGGEPMLWLRENLGALESAVDVLERAGKRVHLHTQTSGTVLPDRVLDFIRARSVAVGVSCDGPPRLNDLYRKSRSGRGTSGAIESCFETLRAREIPFGVICSVGSRSVEHARDIVDYFRRQGIARVRFNPVWDYPRARDSGVAVEPGRYLAFYLDLLGCLYEQNGGRPQVMSVDLGWMLKNVRSRDRTFMCLRSPCGAGGNPMLAVDPDGDLFPCEKMIAQPEHRAGSVFEEASLAAVRSLPAMVRVRERTVQAIPECRGCDWRAFCGGGCPADVTAAGRGLLEPDPNCEFYRSIFETLITRLAGDETFLDRVYPTELRVRQSPRMQACEGGGGDGR